MVNEAVAKTIENQFQFDLNYLDFFYPYAEAKGYDDVESDTTDEEYEALETQFFSVLPRQELSNLKYEIQRFIERRIKELMTEVVEMEEDR